jgi:hypothetical protein
MTTYYTVKEYIEYLSTLPENAIMIHKSQSCSETNRNIHTTECLKIGFSIFNSKKVLIPCPKSKTGLFDTEKDAIEFRKTLDANSKFYIINTAFMDNGFYMTFDLDLEEIEQKQKIA